MDKIKICLSFGRISKFWKDFNNTLGNRFLSENVLFDSIMCAKYNFFMPFSIPNLKTNIIVSTITLPTDA